MKVLVIACVLFACLVAVQCQSEQTKQFLQECKKENNVSDEECKAFHESGMDKSKATSSIKCASKCLFEKLQIIRNGDLSEEGINSSSKNIPMEKVKQAVLNCSKESGVDECDDAFQKGTCVVKALDLNSSL